MNGRNLLEGRTGPVTQSVDAIKNLLAYVGRSSEPMPSDVSLDNGRLVLVLSNKKDAYYTTTATKCSCPARDWHPNQPCKHQRKHFPEAKATTMHTASEPFIQRGGFKPVDMLPSEERAASRAASSSFCMVDTTPDTTEREAAYWSIQADRDMWPAEA